MPLPSVHSLSSTLPTISQLLAVINSDQLCLLCPTPLVPSLSSALPLLLAHQQRPNLSLRAPSLGPFPLFRAPNNLTAPCCHQQRSTLSFTPHSLGSFSLFCAPIATRSSTATKPVFTCALPQSVLSLPRSQQSHSPLLSSTAINPVFYAPLPRFLTSLLRSHCYSLINSD